MSIETKKISDQLHQHIFSCDDTGDKMVNVWARLNTNPLPHQIVEACWVSKTYRGSGKHELSGHLSCTVIESGKQTELVDFITTEGEVRSLKVLVKQL